MVEILYHRPSLGSNLSAEFSHEQLYPPIAKIDPVRKTKNTDKYSSVLRVVIVSGIKIITYKNIIVESCPNLNYI